MIMANLSSVIKLCTVLFVIAQLIGFPPTSTVLARDTGQEQTESVSAHSKERKGTAMSWVKLHRMFPATFVMNGPRSGKLVALTFDDVPDPRYTPAILDILAQHDVCATFFVVGSRAAQYPAIIQRMNREGHIIGNHSYNHALYSRLSQEKFEYQIWRTNVIIRHFTGLSPLFIRPPYGEIVPAQVRWGMRNGYTVINWDVDSEDWRVGASSDQVMSNIDRTLQSGSIVLQHGGGDEDLSGTIEALPRLINKLRSEGYELVTLPELLGKKAYR
ncbi:polysaccharide deacetylase family protein [Paenibacillus chungangensis]|uniref:Polysaccharide deacetylase family protein n=1 Tax=Paenibacillus chungangensis TaxID=696535 RepID=A0ABW3HT06_9BACL